MKHKGNIEANQRVKEALAPYKWNVSKNSSYEGLDNSDLLLVRDSHDYVSIISVKKLLDSLHGTYNRWTYWTNIPEF